MRKISLLTIVGVVLVLSTGVAAAAGGSLTAFEYQQLSYTRQKIKSANNLNTAIFDCAQIQMQSKLLTYERADCMSQFQLEQFPTEMKTYVKDCGAYGSAAARVKCLVTPYEQAYKEVTAQYRAESGIHLLALARGLGEACADELSDTPVVISDEKLEWGAMGRLIKSAKAGNVPAFESYSRTVIAASDAVAKGQAANTGPLSICPHPGSNKKTGTPSV